jgi:hypothetical protein
MKTIAQISTAMQHILEEVAEQKERETGFVRRQGKLDGKSFVQAMVFGALGSPELSYTDLSQSAGTVGVRISPQGLEQRFTPAASQLMEAVLQAGVKQVMSGSATRIPILQRFAGVYVRDSSVIPLPLEWREAWPGVGSQAGGTAGLKLHVSLNFSSGELHGPVITNARTHDRWSPFQTESVPAGSLKMADLGFFDLDQFATDQAQEVYWLGRFKVGTVVLDLQGQRIDLVSRLQGVDQLDCPILLGAVQRIPCRLLAQRVPQEVVDQRRRRLREYATRKQVPLSAQSLALAQWTLLITNVPQEKLSLKEALTLYGVRWQIEMLFKLWKHHAKIDEWRSHNPHRILCEVYAKLIAVLILHWNFILAFWAFPARSLFKAAQVVQKFAPLLASSFGDTTLLQSTLQLIQNRLQSGCFLNTRSKKPDTYQLLLALDPFPS